RGSKNHRSSEDSSDNERGKGDECEGRRVPRQEKREGWRLRDHDERHDFVVRPDQRRAERSRPSTSESAAIKRSALVVRAVRTREVAATKGPALGVCRPAIERTTAKQRLEAIAGFAHECVRKGSVDLNGRAVSHQHKKGLRIAPIFLPQVLREIEC